MKTINIKIWLLFLIGLFLLSSIVSASLFSSGDITFSVNQKDYYFKTGENAIIPLNIENTYGKQIDGVLTYTYTQEINQGGMHMSSSNSQSTSLSAKDGKTTQGLNFGTSNNPSELDVNLKFVYTQKESRIVNLDGIKIHFVTNKNQTQNQQNKQSSSSKEYTKSQQTQNSGQDPFSQMQKQINQMMNNNNNQQPQNSQQALQNNQMAQDSSALKQQMENQIKKQEAMKQAFQKQLAQNQEFQKEHQKLLNQGYNLTNANVNPSSNNTGDFDLDYQNKNGEKSSLKGHMENGKMQNLQKDTPKSRQEMQNQLEQNKQFKEYQKQLQKQGYSEQNTKVSQEQNKTNVKVNYANKNNETATISADIVNNTVQNVELQKAEKEKQNYWWILLILLLLAIFGYFAYKKLNNNLVKKLMLLKRKKKSLLITSQKVLNYLKNLKNYLNICNTRMHMEQQARH